MNRAEKVDPKTERAVDQRKKQFAPNLVFKGKMNRAETVEPKTEKKKAQEEKSRPHTWFLHRESELSGNSRPQDGKK